MSQQTVTTTEELDKPLTGSWRAKIQKNKGFIMLVEEILQQIPTQGKDMDAKIRVRVLENCETIWKLGAADKCVNNGNNGEVKKLRNEAILDAKSEPVETIEAKWTDKHDKIAEQYRRDEAEGKINTTLLIDKTASINSAPEAQKAGKNKTKKTRKKSCDC